MLALVERCCSVLLSTLALLLPAVLVSQPAVAWAGAPCSPGLAVAFRFHASAPIVAAPVSSNGNIAVASLDGYVHALGPNGRFLWSYTLDSTPVAVDIGRDGRVYAASDSGRIAVLRSSGELEWGAALPLGMVPTGPIAQSERGVVFVPSNLNVYALSLGSGLMWRAFVGSKVTSGPVIGPQGDAWVVAQNGEVHRIRTQSQRSKFVLEEKSGTRVVAAIGEQVFFVDASGLTARSSSGQVVWTVSDVEQVTADVRVARIGDKWVWLDALGKRQAERELAVEASGEPVHAQGYVYVPSTNGRLYVFGKEGAVEWCQVAHAPLLHPRVDSKNGAVTVASGDGWLVSIQKRRREGEP